MDIKKLWVWLGLTQVEMAGRLGIRQGTLSDIINGKARPSENLLMKAADVFSPHVLFVSPSKHTDMIISAMLAIGQIDEVIEQESSDFEHLLKEGLTIAVVTNDKEPYLTLIAKALEASGLSCIPTRGLKVSEEGKVEVWNA